MQLVINVNLLAHDVDQELILLLGYAFIYAILCELIARNELSRKNVLVDEFIHLATLKILYLLHDAVRFRDLIFCQLLNLMVDNLVLGFQQKDFGEIFPVVFLGINADLALISTFNHRMNCRVNILDIDFVAIFLVQDKTIGKRF